MKGFSKTGKMPKQGFAFPEKFGFTSSSGKVQQVGGYTRRAPIRKAEGGQVPGIKKEPGSPGMVYDGKATTIGDQGNSAELRTKPLTEFDKDHGGRGPLRPGFATGGAVPKYALGGLGQIPRRALPRAPGGRPMYQSGGKVKPAIKAGGSVAAQKVMNRHLKTAAPKGHKGLGQMCK